MDRKRLRPSFLIRLSFWLCLLTSTCILNNCQAAEVDKEGGDGYGYRNEHGYHENENFGHAFLTEDSVVLITGAAGFLGSELALALHRTYSPRRIICVDRMIHPESQEELALFEFQRQRSFNVMQTLGDKGRFYRVDFSPMIPEYFDLGEVPVLDHIFRENLDITHVVHLADPFPHSALQVVPREKEVPKAGMMEALMEQLAKHERERKYSENGDSDYIPPHFVYASSFEVYPHHNSNNNNNNDPHSKEERENTGSSSTSSHLLEETQTLSTPSSLRGASKVMDEMLAKLYYDTKNISSVGLRFFTVYGPWGVPGSPLFEMAERAVTGDLDGIDEDNNQKEDWMRNSQYNNHDIWKESIHDFVYIDDAVDAMMAAMQFRTSELQPSSSTEGENNAQGRRNPHPIIFNVASGQGHSLDDVLNIMQEFFPPISKKNASSSTERRTERIDVGSVGSTKRAGTLLGFKPQVNLREGIIKMLAWHYDRAFPYGGRGHTKDESDNVKVHNENEKKSIYFANQGIVGCSPYDKECLRGTPVFPCASECSHEAQCTKSYYDEVIGWTQALTSECATVLYTVDLDESLQSLPSANPKLQTSSKSFLKGTCNLAFVSQNSLLFQALQNPNRGSSFMGSSSSSSSTSGRRDDLFRDGSWVIIPLKVAPLRVDDSNDVIDKNEILRLLPKLSPGLFFGGNTKRAIYIDPDIMLDNIPKLLREASAQPYSEEMEGATAMLIGKGTPKDYFADDGDEEEEMMMMMDDPNHRQRGLESTNTLVQNAAYRMVRIAVSDNLFGDGFMELLDSRWIVHTLQSDDGRLFRCDVLGEIVQWEVTTDRSALEFVLGLHDMWSRVIAKASGVGPWWIGDNVKTVPEGHGRRRRLLEEVEVDVVDRIGNDRVRNTNIDDTGADTGADTKFDKIDGVEQETGGDDEESEEDSEEEEQQNLGENSGEGEENERGEFLLDAVAQKEVAANEEKRGDSSDEQEDIRLVDNKQEGDNENEEESHNMERDLSSYDTWMGILSSSSVKYFVRIVPSSEVGVVSITDRS